MVQARNRLLAQRKLTPVRACLRKGFCVANRYLKRSRLNNWQLEHLLWGVCYGSSAPAMAKRAGISERSAGKTMRELRERLSSNESLLSHMGLQPNWPPANHQFWHNLYTCIFDCPSEIRELYEHSRPKLMYIDPSTRRCNNCDYIDFIDDEDERMSLRISRKFDRGWKVSQFKSIFLIYKMQIAGLTDDRIRAVKHTNVFREDGTPWREAVFFDACKRALISTRDI